MNRKDFITKSAIGLAGLALHQSSATADGIRGKSKTISSKDKQVQTDPQSSTKTIIHTANSRGSADHGWLKTFHTFSFADYYDEQRMNFGALRVLNDDTVDAGRGFGTHPHDNMEIITIPLEGALAHKDSMGNSSTIKSGDIQVMSAGTGIRHSEYNANTDRAVKLLQIWVLPDKRNVKPRYDQVTLNIADRKNNLQMIVSPEPKDAGVWIHQSAWFHLGTFDKDFTTSYKLKKNGNGVYAFVIEGSVKIGDKPLQRRDGLGIWDTDSFVITSLAPNSELLLMEVPMTF
jgi:quercetin 2,3-dioxygenase